MGVRPRDRPRQTFTTEEPEVMEENQTSNDLVAVQIPRSAIVWEAEAIRNMPKSIPITPHWPFLLHLRFLLGQFLKQ